jgi:hypothetical protein
MISGPFCTIVYNTDESYSVCMTMRRPGSVMCQIAFIPRSLMEWEMHEAQVHGGVVEPYINYGLH